MLPRIYCLGRLRKEIIEVTIPIIIALKITHKLDSGTIYSELKLKLSNVKCDQSSGNAQPLNLRLNTQ